MKTIRLSKCSISNEDVLAAEIAIRSEVLGLGPEVNHFEKDIKDCLGTDFEVVCVNSGTSALVLALSALGIGPGDEVIIPSLTYVASFQAVSNLGALPIACDVSIRNGFIDVEDARKRVTEKTKAIMPVHYGSFSSGMEEVYDLANDYGLRVVEDAAHAFGCKVDDKYVGSFGDIICFSFDGIKNITCGEGGAVLTADKNVTEKVRNASMLGVEQEGELRISGSRNWDFDIKHLGFRAHMSNVNAAIGRSQLLRLEKFTLKRQTLAKAYTSLLKSNKNIELFDFDFEGICPHIFPVRVKNQKRKSVLKNLKEAGIEYGFHYKPNHLHRLWGQNVSLPNSELLWGELISLPLHYDLSETELLRVTEVVNSS